MTQVIGPNGAGRGPIVPNCIAIEISTSKNLLPKLKFNTIWPGFFGSGLIAPFISRCGMALASRLALRQRERHGANQWGAAATTERRAISTAT